MAVHEYNLKTDGSKFLSGHFQVKEFRSYDDTKNYLYSDEVKIDDELIRKLEQLFDMLHCSTIHINSGYRTLEHERSLGGSGRGQHVLGKAADIVCKGQNGNIIPAQIICCAAQEIGFSGIANISKRYLAVHVDVRDTGTYKGDETRGYSSVCSSFFDYFGISREEFEKYTK